MMVLTILTAMDSDDDFNEEDEVFQWWVLLQWWLLASCFCFGYLGQVDGFEFGFVLVGFALVVVVGLLLRWWVLGTWVGLWVLV